MSHVYNLEPQPTGKVVLHTTSGDILFELFAKQAPLASRNFLQHCLDGYYNDTIFHRVVPGFILQGGDPTGTGFGGESTFENGAPFADEFHSRLKFNRRGLLGMANSGDKDDNGSQFFITLGNTPELTGKNTMFGRIEGDTIFNVVKMADADLLADGSERPMYPTKITGAEILLNPFDDMVKRSRVARSSAVADTSTKKKVKRKGGKALLSFGDDADGEAVGPAAKKPKFNSNLVEGDVDIPSPRPAAKSVKSKVRVQASMRSSPEPEKKTQPIRSAPVAIETRPNRSPSVSTASSRSPSPTRQRDQLTRTNDEIAALKASLRRSGPAQPAANTKPKSALEAMIPETSTRGRKRGAQGPSAAQEARSMAMFKAFRDKLDAADGSLRTKTSTVPPANPTSTHTLPRDAATDGDNGDDEEEAALCDLHFIANCQSCGDWTEAGGGDDGGGGVAATADSAGDDLFSHTLSFAKDRLGKDLEWKRRNEEELVVVDPRERARELGVARVAGPPLGGRGGREWDRKRDAQSARTR